jgi:CheY-like chemotaxis protein
MGVTLATVLIVDDDAFVVVTFGRMLRLAGYDVSSASDGDAALRETAAHRPDVILVDLHMPRLNGVAFLRQLRLQESPRRTPVAVITGDYFMDDELSNALRDLDAIVCFKPLWLDDLVGIVERLLGTPSLGLPG